MRVSNDFALLRLAVIQKPASLSCLVALLLLLSMPVLAADRPTIAASADMSWALTEIANGFSRQTNQRVKLTFGSSGALAQRIVDGAAIELFLAGDEASAMSLRQRGKAEDEGTIFGVGRIALFTPARKSGNLILPNIAALKEALEQGRVNRVVISNPDLCPYGRAAREALLDAGIWSLLVDKLQVAEDAAQAGELALGGEVDAAILPLAIVMSPVAKSRGKFSVIDSKMHKPLRQRMVVLTNAGGTARAFYSYMQAPVAREVLRRYGYTFPLK